MVAFLCAEKGFLPSPAHLAHQAQQHFLLVAAQAHGTAPELLQKGIVLRGGGLRGGRLGGRAILP